MVVLVLTACPPGLRGYLTRWLLELSAGVFVGKVSARVREMLWQETVGMVSTGRALLVYSTRNEQHLSFRTHGHHWIPVDLDGVTMILRPHATSASADPASTTTHKTGWSKAARRRKYGHRL